MASNYPASLDTTATLPAAGGVGANLSTFPHSTLHGNADDAIIAVETELGVAPSGSFSTVKARLDSGDASVLGKVLTYASAAARNAAIPSPVEGQFAYLIDTNALSVYTGATWTTFGTTSGALGGWTPTVTQTGSVTVTNTYSRLQRYGRHVTGWFSVAVTGAGSGGTPVIVSVPLTAAQADIPVGIAQLFDTSGNLYFHVELHLESTSTFSLRNAGGAGDQRLGVAAFTSGLASGDLIKGQFNYEAAAD